MASIVLCTKHLRWRSSTSVSVTPNNSHSAVVLGAFVSLRGYNAAELAEYAHTPCVNYAKRIATNFQRRMAMLRISRRQT